MEAAGLLGGEVTGQGDLVADGALVVRAGAPADEPLSRLLVAGAARESGVDAAVVTRLLDTISLDPTHLQGEEERTVVTVDGRFRIGMLRGRNHKVEAEHIGLSARRAALERQRREAQRRLDVAMAILEATESELTAGRVHLANAQVIRRAVPSPRSVQQRVAEAEAAEKELRVAETLVVQRQRERNLADDAHAERVEKVGASPRTWDCRPTPVVWRPSSAP